MSIFDSIDQRLDTISERITTSGEAFASLLDTRIATLTPSADDVTRSLSHMLDERDHRHGLAARRRRRDAQRRVRDQRLTQHREDAWPSAARR